MLASGVTSSVKAVTVAPSRHEAAGLRMASPTSGELIHVRHDAVTTRVRCSFDLIVAARDHAQDARHDSSEAPTRAGSFIPF
jgi:hypothetical protein